MNTIHVQNSHLAYFFCAAAAWGTMLAQAQVFVINHSEELKMRAHYLKIEPNKIYTVALKYLKPAEVKGLSGREHRWTLADGLAMYTPLHVAEELAKLGVKPGHRFTIEKHVEKGRPEWKLARVEGQPAQRMLELAPSLDSPVPEGEEEDPPVTPLGKSSRLQQALITAVNAANAAEKEGQALGYNVRFGPADIRAMAISVLIQMERAA